MRTLSIVAALLLAPALAAAQPAAPSPAAPSTPAKPRIIDITDGDTIDGDRPTGELVPVAIRDIARSSSLLRIRHDFIDMILKAAEGV